MTSSTDPKSPGASNPEALSESHTPTTTWNAWTRVAGWASFVAQVTIVATGGAVRLTQSGLGCPTWPLCTASSLVPTAELSYHSLIEFGNRLMTGAVGIIAVILLTLAWRRRPTRPAEFVLAWVVVGGVATQALIGGITVHTDLNPFIVGLHFVVSVLLVCASAAFVVCNATGPGPRHKTVPRWYYGMTHGTSAVFAITLALGILTTGAGPHSGDPQAGRNGFNAVWFEHIHSWPAYVLVVCAAGLAVLGWRLRLAARTPATLLLIVLALQASVGVWQSRAGLPATLVGIHMVFAVLAAATLTWTILACKAPTPPA